MAEPKHYRERVPLPGWARPALGALGAMWLFRRTRKSARTRPAWRTALTAVSSVMTLLTVFRTVSALGKVAVEVESSAIRVGLGPIEHRIAAANVRDVRVVDYNPLRYLGWGYRIAPGGRRAFSQIGVRRGVEITANEDGKQRRYFVSSNDPEALAAAVAGAAGVETA